MSEQEPVDKRMLGQLRDHTESYLPEAWEHFELFRASKRRRKRMALYWLSAAALLVIFGTALLTRHIMDRGEAAKIPIAQKQTNGVQANPIKPALSEKVSAPRPSPFAAGGKSTIESKKVNFIQENPPVSQGNPSPATNDRLTEHPLPAAGIGREGENFSPGFLPSRSFNFPVARFRKLYIALPRQQIHPSPKTTRPVRWGVALSQQSNRAAHTSPELNYGLGGVLLLPLSGKVALATGVSGSKQSLNVEEPDRMTAAAGSAQLQRVRYHWVNLEIPLQIHYRLRTFKNIGFTAAGGIALQASAGQAADYHYKTTRTIATFAETAGGPVLLSTQTVEELSSVTENDKKRDWTVGCPLYLGLGISYQRQKTALEIEPYVKYPLGTSTADRLQLTTVGIQLRLTGSLTN